MKKTIIILMFILPFMTLLGGYISCSDIYYEPHLKAGVGFVLFGQHRIFFLQGLICKISNMSNKIKAISLSISLLGSLFIMIVYNFLGISVMIIILLVGVIMFLVGHESIKIIGKLINEVKSKIKNIDRNK